MPTEMTEFQCPVCGGKVSLSAVFRGAYCGDGGTSVSGRSNTDGHYAAMFPTTGGVPDE